MTITYWNKTHNFILSWLGSTTKSNKDGSTQITLDVNIKHTISWLGSTTKSNECEPTKLSRFRKT
jgi:hypothetical protein